MSTITDATLRLFKALPAADSRIDTGPELVDVYRHTIPRGYIVDPAVLSTWEVDDVRNLIEEMYGVDAKRLNNTFHKSFAKVRNSSDSVLVFQQLLHYLTTYGAEAVGAFDAESVYVPTEALDIPAIDIEGFDFVVIRGMSDVQLKTALLELLSLGVALGDQTLEDVATVARHVALTANEISMISNREAQVRLYNNLGLAPTDPVEFLRYITYIFTGSSLLIKNKSAYQALSEAAQEEPYGFLVMFDRYRSQAGGLNRLAEIFNRYKPLFLALRSARELRPLINEISRLSKTHHKPMRSDYLNEVTARIRNETLDWGLFAGALENANVFRKARLAQALSTRMHPELDSIVYKIRNGRSWADDFEPFDQRQRVACGVALHRTLQSIADGATGNLAGKHIYIPEGVVYGLPATEKQFTGNFPTGTYIEAPEGEGLVAGIHWTDVDGRRVDLDLSLVSAGTKIGWDGYYRDNNRSVLFTGDMTSAPAPDGASEVFWFQSDVDNEWLMNVNYFNYDEATPVPYRIVVGTLPAGIDRNHTLDPNCLIADASVVLDTRQAMVGLVTTSSATNRGRFYFSASEGGGGISARSDNNTERARRFMTITSQNLPTLNDVLALSGAVLVDTADKADDGLDLSPAKIDKTTILSLLGKS